MARPFYSYLNPLVAAALSSEDKRKKQQASVTVSPEYNATGAPDTAYLQDPNVTRDAKRAVMGVPPASTKSDTPYVPNVPSQIPVQNFYAPSPTVGNIMANAGISDQEAQLAQLNQQQQQKYGALADLQLHADPLDLSLHGMRDAVRGRIQAEMNRPTEATYNPVEEGGKGQLRHIGESILYAFAHAPINQRTGQVDPVAAGIAASLTALFGGGGIHKNIAREYQQPQLDAQNAREQAQTERAVRGLGTLSTMYPNQQQNQANAIGTQLASIGAQKGELNKDIDERTGIAKQDYFIQRQLEAQREAAAQAQAANLQNTIVGRILGQHDNQTQRNGAYAKFNVEMRNKVDEANKVLDAKVEQKRQADATMSRLKPLIDADNFGSKAEREEAIKEYNKAANVSGSFGDMNAEAENAAKSINAYGKLVKVVNGRLEVLPEFDAGAKGFFDKMFPDTSDKFNTELSRIPSLVDSSDYVKRQQQDIRNRAKKY